MFRVTVDNRQFGQPLTTLVDRLGEPAEVLEAIGNLLETNVRRRAETATDPSGKPWAAWADSTRDAYPWPGSDAAAGKEGPGNGRLLDRYGTMLASLSYQVGRDSVVIGFGQDYAVFHEWGTKHMPRRGLLMADPDEGTLGAEDNAAVLDLVSSWLDELLA
jgi:phage gpG-like protein